ncbi:addiction module protein [Pleomorphovibrio marinus]|uniref:addiction module protein n=1 Tax=Pleomorphovibrio marinus TaxID=2164132 RepID=UPI000E0A5634|nr:addiction module protein [Pleomorphovibrio marinus]
MDIQTIKVDLIRWLTELQDRTILEQLQAFKHRQEEGLSETHKALLDERIASYEKDPGKALDWDDVMKELEKDL